MGMKAGLAGCLGTAFLGTLAQAQSTLFTFYGDAQGDRFGWSASAAGDFNNDGHLDLVVGAPYDDAAGNNAGQVRVFSGKNGAVLLTKNGAKAYDHFGTSVANVGDVNNDGTPDLLVGADGTDVNGSSSGSATLYSGKTWSVLFHHDGSAIDDVLGASCAGIGDVNNDGRPDYIVGSPWNDNANGANAGVAKVFSGANGALLYTKIGDVISDCFGTAVAKAGDVNNDGRADFIVGAPLGDLTGNAAGYARVFSGANGATLYTLKGDSVGDNFGASVGAAGDVNADGWDDVVIGAPYDDALALNGGTAYVFSGKTGALLHKAKGDSANDLFGASVNGAGDVDRDGYDDFLVGATWDDNNGINSGAVRVFSGFDASVLYTLSGDSADDQLGYNVQPVGDVNKDGVPDFATSTYMSAVNGTNSGMARIFSPLPMPVITYCTSKTNSKGCTPQISYTGTPKASGTAPFNVRVNNELPNKKGTLFYSYMPQSVPFQGGWLCLSAPLKRTVVLSSGGSQAQPCSGSYSYDFNAFIRNGNDPGLVAGEGVCVQFWSRDKSSQGSSNLSNALRFVINP